ncbi:peptidylprolyl isomerase [Paraferrimonas sedimenticola]|uniref:Peptidyl-prolyl cis-trans isomerase n=1 Tax=Paraferrimonas sedimenticola TaxID=375674 RepID=A0AA37W194_9GAMM|nr:peptidylprolyl isomerase [Paraferrimonas sedimenticola]GLP97165.1 peptidyl-prolyl cis-trans isomerase [Paraferrimonas sedimenticola]
MKICENKVVTLHYRLHDDQGQLIESSFDSEPMQYLHGAENMIPGLEVQLEGKQVGDTMTAEVPADQAYGDYQESLRQSVPIEAFGNVEDIIPGMRFIAETDVGQRPVQVVEVSENEVVVDGNHPLAGVALSFEVEVVEVRDASADEIAHGHVHPEASDCDNEGGCCGGAGHEDPNHQCCGGGGCKSH